MNSSYRILKLQSGEEIIAKIKGKKGGKIVLEKPMIFKTTTRNDMFGQSKEITFLKDWLSNTLADVTAIPENFIVSWLVPSQDVTRLYDLERNNKKPRHTKKNAPSPHEHNPLYSKEVLDKILDELKNMDDESMNNPPTTPFDMGDKFVFMHMMLPPDVVKEMFEEGLLDFDSDMMEENYSEEINEDKYTGEDTDDPDYGNRWTDWNPDPHNDEYN